MREIHGEKGGSVTERPNPHFLTVPGWEEAEALLSFTPRIPRETAGNALRSLQIYVRDHRQRELPVSSRTLEAHYGAFTLGQSLKGEREARRWALEVTYGRDPRPFTVAGHPGRTYALGPEPAPDDIDPRMPAVVVWHEGARHFLLASDRLPVETLLEIAGSLYR